MNELQATGVLILMFSLRCVIPALLIFGIGTVMNRLADKWRLEDEQRQVAPRHYCQAFSIHGLRCWSARLLADGELPAECVECPIYAHAAKVKVA